MRNVDGLRLRAYWWGGRSFGGKVGGGEFRRGLLWRMMGGRVV